MAISSSGAVTSTGTIGGSNSATLATTGSNTFTGQQYISNTNAPVNFTDTASLYTDGGLRVGKDAYVSGTLYLNNLTVYGTQSVNFITSSQLDIADNIITVNTSTPAIRFGGIAVRDSGSLGTGLTGSLLWDSQNNHWVYTNPSGSSYSGGMMISGPRASSLGEEQGTTFNALMKGQGGDHITSSGMFESSSMIGIGTSSPAYTLDVQGTGRFTSTVDGTIFNSTSNAFRLNGNNALSLVTLNSQSVVKINAAGFWGVQLVGANDQGIVINNTGNVGIGTSSPNSKLDVLVASNNRVQIGTGIIGSSGEYVGGLYYASNKLRIESFLVGSGYQSILLQPDGGNVLLGTSSDVGQRLRIFQPSVAQWNIKLIQLNGSDQLFQEFLTTTDNDATNTARGSIRYNGTNVLYLGTSDYRLKEDLKDYNGLDIISQIKTYDFNWKEANKRDYGVMAHELQEVLPNYVTGAKDDINEDGSINPQQVDYSKLVPVLIKAIQELKAQINELKAQING
jgi:hypothetical protein